MKKFFSLCLLLCLAFGLQAQVKKEITVHFDSKCWLRSHAYSKTFKLSDTLQYGFLGLSAYTTDTVHRVQLSFRSRQNGEWSSWQTMQPPHDGKGHGRQAFSAEPIMEKIEALEFRSSDSLDEPVIFRLFMAPPAEKKSPDIAFGVQPLSNDSCNCPQPAICERLCWCPDSSCAQPTYTPTSPTHIIVHHSAGFTNYNDYQWVVSYYWDLHVNTNGWTDIGYNWLVDPNGVIYEGRGQGNLGAHFSCLNGETIGICLIGNYMNNQPQLAGLVSLENLIIWESCSQGIIPSDSSVHTSSQLLLNHVSGHRNANSATVGCPSGTVCPGDLLYPKLDSLAASAAQRPCLLHQREFKNTRLTIYPNPAQEVLQLEGIEAQSNYKVYNLQGQLLLNGSLKGSGQINLQALKPGQYLLYLPQSGLSRSFSISR